ncbi:hypothetical protein KAU33_03705 [Candidatus Dependentiae bacterium]|nr:hypothetical protein [Candidatus Dependentiae bacterium]
MKKILKLLLGLGAYYCALYFVAFLLMMFLFIFGPRDFVMEVGPKIFEIIGTFLFIAMIVNIICIVIFLIHIITNKDLTSNQRLLWIILTLVFFFITGWYYWNEFIWSRPLEKRVKEKLNRLRKKRDK